MNKGNVIAYGETQCVLTAENLAKTFNIWAEIDETKKEIIAIEKLKNNEFLSHHE